MLDEYDRFSTIGFEFTFADENGAALTPPGADLYISYKVNGVLTQSGRIQMTMNGAVASYGWNSRIAQADAGKVDWVAFAAGNVSSTRRGSFTLGDNSAYPAS